MEDKTKELIHVARKLLEKVGITKDILPNVERSIFQPFKR